MGDTLTVHVTNIEQSGDMIHGFGVAEQNVNVVMDPGETKTFKITLKKPGVFPFYCTNFCSVLHQEMQGYLLVQPAADATAAAPAAPAAPVPVEAPVTAPAAPTPAAPAPAPAPADVPPAA